MESLTTSIAAKSSAAGVTEHAAEDSGITVIPTIITNCPPGVVIEDFSSASAGATGNADQFQGLAWTRTYVCEVRPVLASPGARFFLLPLEALQLGGEAGPCQQSLQESPPQHQHFLVHSSPAFCPRGSKGTGQCLCVVRSCHMLWKGKKKDKWNRRRG